MKMPTDNPMFTLFNRLPTEIRLKIWEAALPGPRVISIIERRVKRKGHSTFDPRFPTGAQEGMLALWSPSKAPSTLFACRKSHQITSKFLVPCFAFASSIPETYFDFRVDTLYLRFDTFVFHDTNEDDNEFQYFIHELESIYDTDHVLKVRNLAISLDPGDIGARNYQLAWILSWFGNIQNLTIVVGHFDREDDGEGDILFVEAIDVLKTCQNYEAFSPIPPQLHEIPETPLAVDLVSKDELERSLEEQRQLTRCMKQEFMDQGVEVGDLGDIPMPLIEYKSVVTGGLKSYLDSLREEYQQKIEERKMLRSNLRYA
jgi:hypothetical protein